AVEALRGRIHELLAPISPGETRWFELKLDDLGLKDASHVAGVLSGAGLNLSEHIVHRPYNVQVTSQEGFSGP
ncbi:MAG: hypothetical protein Q8P02_01920, partial [Candidatus Micrarchaeota archaeon]|nr:hypothetical protein [Candidatus Micrarchaeota archaeon]